MPSSAFPLSKAKLSIRACYRWRVMKFECLQRRFRVLIAYRQDKEVFLAYLAEDLGSDMHMLARYEYHATHPGWHFHGNCAGAPLVSGRLSLPDRVPLPRSRHRDQMFNVSGDDAAHNKAISAFGLDNIKPATDDLFS